jgi:hypothetical protein
MWNRVGNAGSYYNIATTVKEKWSESYQTYIVWDYDNNACSVKDDCPASLIGTASGATVWALMNNQKQDINQASSSPNQGIPYPVKDL